MIFNFSQDWDESNVLVQDAVVTGSSVVECSLMYNYELEYGIWYRSKERKGGKNPFPSFMMNKKWTLVEEFNNHMLRFQQVRVSSRNFSKLHFGILGWVGGQ